ncbi:MAG: phospholipase D-like domain-containing protein [Burkholderiaceae bacterium]
MLDDLTLTHWLTLHGLVTAVAVLAYVVNSHVVFQRRHPTAAIAWMLFIVLLPYLALPAFLLFGSRKLARPQPATPPEPCGENSDDFWAIKTIQALGQPAPAPYSQLNLHADGDAAREALLATLDGAQVSIDMCTFILRDDPLGNAVLERLCRQAAKGLRVRLLLDGMGSLMAGRPSMRRLFRAGGEFVLFVPPLRSPLKGRTNLRDHRKLVIADAARTPGHTGSTGRLWCGGRNLASEYFDGAPGEPAWRDLSFDLGGPLVCQANDLFERDWAFASGRPIGALWSAQPVKATPPASPETAFVMGGAQLVASGPDQADDTVHALLVSAAYRARHRIALATPYFVPESALLMALCLAARRGVVVDLLLPAVSNHRLSDLARARALRSLAQAGGRIWLAPGMMHAKLAAIDDVLALAGSVNLDSRSLFLNYEMMIAFHKGADVRRFAAWFDAERKTASRYVAVAPGLMRDAAEGMILWLGFQL